MSDPIRRLYCHIKKKSKRLLLPAVILIAVCSVFFIGFNQNKILAQALDPNINDRKNNTYEIFNNLFSGTTKGGVTRNARLVIASGFSNLTRISDITFSFNGAFNTKNGNVGDFWDKIEDFDKPNVFILRICEVGNDRRPKEDISCQFSPFPYQRKIFDHTSALNLAKVLKDNNISTIAQLKDYINERLKQKIHHYTATNFREEVIDNLTQAKTIKFDETEEIDIFLVNTKLTDWYYLLNNKLKKSDLPEVFIPGARYQIDLWYCVHDDADFPSGSELVKLTTQVDNIRVFGEICDNDRSAYVRVAGTQFSTPRTATEIQDANSGQIDDPNANTASPSQDVLPDCAIIGTGSFLGCIAKLIYYAIFRPAAWIASLFGMLFDFFLGYSLSDEAYRVNFVVHGWRIIRDITNIFFIILMVWTGLSAVVGYSKLPMKKVVASLIINAILINFSLFFTRVVIDVANITARIFYTRIYVCEGECVDRTGDGKIDNYRYGTGGYWPLSEKIVSAFNPQLILGPILLTNPSGNPPRTEDLTFDSTNIQGITQRAGLSTGDSEYAGFFIIVSLIGTAIMLVVAFIFFKTAFLFLGRVITLYISMMLAPFAILTLGNVPLVGGIKQISWNDWFKNLSKAAVVAPIFVFYLYIIYFILQKGIVEAIGVTIPRGSNFIDMTIYIVIPMAIVLMLLIYGVKLTKEYSDGISGWIQDTATKFIGGSALGVATGGTALIGRNVVGRLGARISQSNRLQNMSSRGGIQGRVADRLLRTGSTLSRKTYDFRNTKTGQDLSKKMGVNLSNSFVNTVGLGTKQTEGGFEGAIKRSEKKLNDRADRFLLTGRAAAAQDAKNDAWESKYKSDRNQEEQQKLQQGQIFDEVSYRQTYEQNNPRPQSSSEINRQREVNYGQSLQQGTFLSRLSDGVTNRATTPTAAGGITLATVGAPVLGSAATIGAAVIGQGAIQSAARSNVQRARASRAKGSLGAGQIRKLHAKLAALQRDQLRIFQTLTPVSIAVGIPVENLSVVDVADYQRNNQNHNMPSPGAVIAERDRVMSQIANVRTQLGI